ncbi:MAG: Polyketide cyclase / dehydrase and lipid transport [Frankiales bacterium]|nr:Polyketide cyclase / dehydrase and lipid transport [Frankiales bacterium]
MAVKLVHRVRTPAPPSVVWGVLGTPANWPLFDVFLSKVKGASREAVVGQHLVGISRWTVLGIPLDVLEVEPERRLVMRVRTAPGITEELTFVLTPTTKGGTDVRVSIVVEGLFAGAAAPLLWLANGLNAHVLASRTAVLARDRAERAKTVA